MYGSLRRALEYIWVPNPRRAPMIVGVAGILLLSCPVGANGAAAARGVDGKVRESAVGTCGQL